MESMEGRFSSFGASVESITKSLEESNLNEEVISQKICAVSDVLTSNWMKQFVAGHSSKQPEQNFRIRLFSKQLEEVCIGLWNQTVARYTAKKLREELNATLRQLCCDLVACPLCAPCGATTQAADRRAYLHRRIMMESKTGKSWLNQCEYQKAICVLRKGKLDVQSLLEILAQETRPDGSPIVNDESVQVNKYKIKLFALLAEALFGQQSMDEAMSVCCTATSLPCLTDDKFASELHQLAVLTHNFGVKCYQNQLFIAAIKWLKSSLELWRKFAKADKQQLSQIFRLLAHCYNETELDENIAKALESVEESLAHHHHPTGILLKLKIIVKSKSATDDVIKELLSELLHHNELQVDLGLDACSFLNKLKRYDFCEFGLDKLLSRFTGSQHIGRVHTQRLLAAIERLPHGDAVDYVEKYIEDDEIVKSLDENSQKLIQVLLWEQAAKRQNEGDVTACLSWYNNSLQLFNACKDENNTERNENISKLFRNKASCLIQLNRLDEAEEMAKQALNLSPDSVYSLFISFKVFVMQGRTDKVLPIMTSHQTNTCILQAIETLNRMTSSATPPSGDAHAFACLAAQLAFEKNMRHVAMVTLDHVVATGKDDSAKLVALRCLVRLHLTMTEEDDDVTEGEVTSEVDKMDVDEDCDHIAKAVACVKQAYEILQNLKSNNLNQNPSSEDTILLPGNARHVMSDATFGDEVTWFMKVAWNIGLRSKDDAVVMRNMFISCNHLLALLPQDGSVLYRRQTCLLMSAASGLEVARSGATKHINTELQNVVKDLDQCQEICDELNKIEPSAIRRDNTTILMCLYRYEALCKLLPPSGDVVPDVLQSLTERIVGMREADEKTFESLAALSVEWPSNHPALFKAALKHAIAKINKKLDAGSKENTQQLINKRSSLYRLLVERLLSEGSSFVDNEESWKVFNEILAINSKHKQDEVELLWLMVKAWNVGVGLFVSNKLVESERWSSLALRYLATIPSYKDAYDTHMNEVYLKILSSKRNADDVVML